MKRAAALLLTLAAACYGRPSPETCERKYLERRYGDDEGYRVCMAEYRRRNGMATEADWYLLESRRAKKGRRQPGVVVQVENNVNAPAPAAPTPPPAAPPEAPPSTPFSKACVRWECRLLDGGQSCSCLEIAAPQSGEISGL